MIPIHSSVAIYHDIVKFISTSHVFELTYTSPLILD